MIARKLIACRWADHELTSITGASPADSWQGSDLLPVTHQLSVGSQPVLTHSPRMEAGVCGVRSVVDDLEYEVLAWLAGGNKVFRPREAVAHDEEAFRAVVAVLGRLRERGLIGYLDGHVAHTESGIYLMVGPVQLTPAGGLALERDRSLGGRPPWAHGPLPWRS